MGYTQGDGWRPEMPTERPVTASPPPPPVPLQVGATDPSGFIDAEVIKSKLEAIEVKIEAIFGYLESLEASMERVEAELVVAKENTK